MRVLNTERHSRSVTHPLLSCAGSEESCAQLHVVIVVVFAGPGHLLPLLPQLILRGPLLLDSVSEVLLRETEIEFDAGKKTKEKKKDARSFLS